MGLNKFSLKLFFFLIIISFLGFGFFWSLSSSQLIITKVVIGILFLSFFIFLLRYINKTNRDLHNFLNAIKSRESIASIESSDLSFDQLSLTYNEIAHQLKKAWLEKEQEHHYFQYTLENINVGIISFDENGDIKLINRAAKSILGITKPRNIKEIESNLVGEELSKLRSEESKLLKLDTAIDKLQILAKCSVVKINQKQYKIISLQNIKTQLEESEIEAWQKLIKVLTHEIMNSVTPIKSLTYSMQKSLSNSIETGSNENLLKGLQAIEKRSKGLLDFVDSYKNLTQIQKPVYQRIYIGKMIENVKSLLNAELDEQNVELSIQIDPSDISVIADEKLITQVLVNLILNSLKALKKVENKRIQIDVLNDKNEHVNIAVTDNGIGVNHEISDKIFIPFFSTYENGSGIGLSFARQVMVLHNGRIEFQSKEGENTTFRLIF